MKLLHIWATAAITPISSLEKIWNTIPSIQTMISNSSILRFYLVSFK